MASQENAVVRLK